MNNLRALTAVVFGVGLSLPVMGFASEDLIYDLIYQCNADEMNETFVQLCSSHYPKISVVASDALSKWRTRNFAKAQLAKNTCEAEIQEKANTGEKEQVEYVRRKEVEVKLEMRLNFLKQLQVGGEQACTGLLAQIADGTGAMDLK